jgi:hypothetical protein
MPNDNLGQDDIDHLLANLRDGTSFEFDDSAGKVDAATVIKKAKAVKALMNKLNFVMAMRLDHNTIRDISRDLHNEMFGLWCANHGITKDDYFVIIKRELRKRKLHFVSTNPPGYKLVRVL